LAQRAGNRGGGEKKGAEVLRSVTARAASRKTPALEEPCGASGKIPRHTGKDGHAARKKAAKGDKEGARRRFVPDDTRYRPWPNPAARSRGNQAKPEKGERGRKKGKTGRGNGNEWRQYTGPTSVYIPANGGIAVGPNKVRERRKKRRQRGVRKTEKGTISLCALQHI